MIYDEFKVLHLTGQGDYSTKVDAIWKARRIKLTVVRSTLEENAASVYVKYAKTFSFNLRINRYKSRFVGRRVWHDSEAGFLGHFCCLFVIGLWSNTHHKFWCFDGDSWLSDAVVKAECIGSSTRCRAPVGHFGNVHQFSDFSFSTENFFPTLSISSRLKAYFNGLRVKFFRKRRVSNNPLMGGSPLKMSSTGVFT